MKLPWLLMTIWIFVCKSSKRIKIYPNNQRFVSEDIKNIIISRKKAFKNKDTLNCKLLERDLNTKLREAKLAHRHQLERETLKDSMKKVTGLEVLWQEMNLVLLKSWMISVVVLNPMATKRGAFGQVCHANWRWIGHHNNGRGQEHFPTQQPQQSPGTRPQQPLYLSPLPGN